MIIDPESPTSSGLPLRVELAARAMEGLMACSSVTATNAVIAATSVDVADKLIAALNKPTS